MFGSPALSVVIGLFATYLFLSLFATTIQEIVASTLNLRGKNLWHGILDLIGNDDVATAFYNHAIIRGYYKGGYIKTGHLRNNLPSYIRPDMFSIALLDVLHKTYGIAVNCNEGESMHTLMHNDSPNVSDLFDKARLIADNIPSGRLHTNMALLTADTKKATEQNLQSWYNDAMTHNVGRYKRQAQRLALLISFVIAVLFNVNTLMVAEAIWHYSMTSNAVQISSETLEKAQTSPLSGQFIADMVGELPLGWRSRDFATIINHNWWRLLTAATGWFFTAVAVSLGSGFWFDSLQKCLRGAGPRIPTSAQAGSDHIPQD